MSKHTEENAEIPIKGPVFISTVYTVTELEDELVEIMDPIEDAYNLAGKEIVERSHLEHYFAAPFSYPYRFSTEGIELIKKRLLNIEVVDPNSIEIRSFPNIPKAQQYFFDTHELEEILISEQYISFTIKDWENIQFMKFPSFLVINFDFTKGQIKSYQDYKALKALWKNKTEEFNKLENLKKVLGISRQKNKWSSVPIATFLALGSYSDVNFVNRYLFGEDESKAQELFLKEASIVERSGDLGNWTTILKHFSASDSDFISHEYTLVVIWRYYYSPDPIFYEGNAFRHKGGTDKYLAKILRSVFFINVVLPSSVHNLRLLDKNIKDQVSNLWNERIKSYNNFSPRQKKTFYSYLINEHVIPEDNIRKEIEGMTTIQKGADQLFKYFESPYLGVPLEHPAVKVTPKYLSGYRQLFHFEKPFNEINDRKKAETLSNELNSILNSVQEETQRYRDEIKSTFELIEGRRNSWESVRNTVLAIIIPAAGVLVFSLGFILYRYYRRNINENLWNTFLAINLPASGALIFGVLYLVLTYYGRI